MLLRLAKIVLVLALACSIGLHWAFFQTVAWTSMLAENLRHDSLNQAVAHTFDGYHPCCLCKAIAAGKKSEKKSEAAPHLKTLEFPPHAEDLALIGPRRLTQACAADTFAETLAITPPSPPPRSLAA